LRKNTAVNKNGLLSCTNCCC